jgi:L-threonylcarbamoyladenylate synthase
LETKRIYSPEAAAKIIREGGIVAFPTETVFGLGVDATNENAVQRLFAAKGRPSNNPLIIHLPAADLWASVAARLTLSGKKLMEAFCPGPITIVLPKLSTIGPLVTANLDTVGIRVPDHPTARAILKSANVPVAAPSANRSGRPSGSTWNSVLEDLEGRIDGIYCEDSPSIGIESTVVLRLGAITLEQIQAVIPAATALDAQSTEEESVDRRAKSPGLLHAHYQPQADVVVVDAPPTFKVTDQNGAVAYCGLSAITIDHVTYCQTYSNVEEYAAAFYEFLREADRRSIQTIFVEAAPEIGIGRALLDRQHRAAAKK